MLRHDFLCWIFAQEAKSNQVLTKLRGQESTLKGSHWLTEAGCEGVLASTLGIIMEFLGSLRDQATGISLITAHAKWIQDHFVIFLCKVDCGYPSLTRWQGPGQVVQRLAVDPVSQPELDHVQLDPDDSRRGGPECLDD
jgi:hypothetical protein